MRISDWSSDVCSSDLLGVERGHHGQVLLGGDETGIRQFRARRGDVPGQSFLAVRIQRQDEVVLAQHEVARGDLVHGLVELDTLADRLRSEEPKSELQSLMRISYAVFCLKKKNNLTDQI